MGGEFLIHFLHFGVQWVYFLRQLCWLGITLHAAAARRRGR